MSQLPAVVRPTVDRPTPAASPLLLCPACFWSGLPQPHLRGSLALESLLWGFGLTGMGLMLLAGQLGHLPVVLPCLPGLGYSVWRRRRRSVGCPQCGKRPLLPEGTLYPPACSHFLFSAEPRRAADAKHGRSSGRAQQRPASQRPRSLSADKKAGRAWFSHYR